MGITNEGRDLLLITVRFDTDMPFMVKGLSYNGGYWIYRFHVMLIKKQKEELIYKNIKIILFIVSYISYSCTDDIEQEYIPKW